MIDVVFTIDYELFGNGAGDVMRDIIEPTRRLLTICDDYGAKLTIMFEVAEYWAFKNAEANGDLRLDYSPADEIEKQIKDAVCRGHDVQLHLHPQWIDAQYKRGLWRLNFNQVKLADLIYRDVQKEDLSYVRDVLYKGKTTLENLLRGVREDYHCIVFRAGGLYIQPVKTLFKAIQQAELWADSSLDSGELVNYRTEFGENRLDEDMDQTGFNKATASTINPWDVFEVPIYSRVKPYYHNFKPTKLIATLKRRRKEKTDPHSKIAFAPQSILPARTAITKLFSPHTFKYDICKLSTGDMLAMFNSVVKAMESKPEESVCPFVSIGHSKDFWNDRAFDRFLKRLSSNQKYDDVFRWSTLSEVVKRMRIKHDINKRNGFRTPVCQTQ